MPLSSKQSREFYAISFEVNRRGEEVWRLSKISKIVVSSLASRPTLRGFRRLGAARSMKDGKVRELEVHLAKNPCCFPDESV